MAADTSRFDANTINFAGRHGQLNDCETVSEKRLW